MIFNAKGLRPAATSPSACAGAAGRSELPSKLAKLIPRLARCIEHFDLNIIEASLHCEPVPFMRRLNDRTEVGASLVCASSLKPIPSCGL
jgi:hypothetical protein